MKKFKTIQINVPAGIDDGQKIRIAGKGEPGINGGPAGDLYVVIRVKPHDFFEREGDHIYCELPIHFTQAALGDEIEVPTVHGKVKLKIPAGTQTGKMFRLRGKGAPNVRGRGTGDQIVKVRIVTPTKLSEKQKQLLREFHQLSGNSTLDEEDSSIFKKFKNAFRSSMD